MPAASWRVIALAPAWIALAVVSLARAQAPASDAAGIEHFETRVRPLLVEHCARCHGEDRQRAELRLDTPAGIRAGGERGAVVVPGDADASRLVVAVRYLHEELQMPPKSRLPDELVETLAEWVALGAPMPEGEAAVAAEASVEEWARRREHWAFQPVRRVDPPRVPGLAADASPIDAFVRAEQHERGLSHSAEAERATLLRRLSFALVGLPPSPDELDAFHADDRPDAFEREVDRLLASPQFGVRWARHWLDLVRYAETRGHEFDLPVANAWQYRDYVVRALNADVPYDRFVAEHVAGDLLAHPRPNPERGFDESVLGTGFWFLGEAVHSPVDVRGDETERVANQVDVFSKAFLGLTVACARCHDHKFDPITSDEYYALCGFPMSAGYRQVRFETDGHNGRIARELDALEREHGARVVQVVAEELAAALEHAELDALAVEEHERTVPDLAALELAPDAVVHADWRRVDAPWMADGWRFGLRPARLGAPRFGVDPERPLVALHEASAACTDPDFAGLTLAPGVEVEGTSIDWSQAGVTLRSATFELGGGKLFVLVRGGGRAYAAVCGHRTVHGPLHGKLVQRWEADVEGWRWIELDVSGYAGERCHVELSPASGELEVALVVEAREMPAAVPMRALELAPDASGLRGELAHAVRALASVADDEASPDPRLARLANVALSCSDRVLAEDARARIRAVAEPFVARRAALLAEIRHESHTAPAMLEGSGFDEHLLVRGSHRSPAGPARRRLIEAVAGSEQPTLESGSGRLELAARLTDPANPLVARVCANRVWHHLFGRGLVPTVDDFGHMGEEPSHPELLDWLASELVREDWSTKRLIRAIVLSATWRQASTADARSAELDPDNRWLARAPLRRLEAEAIRDAILAVSGELDLALGGAPIPVHLTSFMQGRGRPADSGPLNGANRRSLYLAVRRNFLPPAFLVFDFPTPATCNGRRSVSNVPAQALTLMNDPFVVEQAAIWARRALVPALLDDAARVDALFRRAFARVPTDRERELALAFVAAQRVDRELAAADESGHDATAGAWADLCHVLFNDKDFLFLR